MPVLIYPFSPRVSAVLGICEERSKMYMEYIARAQKQITTQSATRKSGVNGFAVEQAIATRRKK
jgi:hypothetical protein